MSRSSVRSALRSRLEEIPMKRLVAALLTCGAVGAVLVPPVVSASPAKPPPDTVAVVSSILVRNKATGIVDPSTRPPSLSISSTTDLRRLDRLRLHALARQHKLQIRKSGAISTLSDPALPDDTAPAVPAISTTASSSYPDPNIGGFRFYFGPTSKLFVCTSGFPVVNGFGYFTVTAGHCGPDVNTTIWSSDGEPWASTITPYDHTRLTKWNPSGTIAGDVSMFSIPSTLPVIRVSPSQNRIIKGGEDPTILEGDICFRGASSAAERCGTVSTVNLVSVVEGRTFPAFCIYKLSAVGGDSGSPIYKKIDTTQARIRGLVSFIWDSDGDGAKDKTCGSPVSKVLSITASTLVTG
jgi:hypothetical protein